MQASKLVNSAVFRMLLAVTPTRVRRHRWGKLLNLTNLLKLFPQILKTGFIFLHLGISFPENVNCEDVELVQSLHERQQIASLSSYIGPGGLQVTRKTSAAFVLTVHLSAYFLPWLGVFWIACVFLFSASHSRSWALPLL